MTMPEFVRRQHPPEPQTEGPGERGKRCFFKGQSWSRRRCREAKVQGAGQLRRVWSTRSSGRCGAGGSLHTKPHSVTGLLALPDSGPREKGRAAAQFIAWT